MCVLRLKCNLVGIVHFLYNEYISFITNTSQTNAASLNKLQTQDLMVKLPAPKHGTLLPLWRGHRCVLQIKQGLLVFTKMYRPLVVTLCEEIFEGQLKALDL